MSNPAKIEIELNGEKFTIESDNSIEQLLVAMGKGTEKDSDSPHRFGAVAVELNGEIVPRDQFQQTFLKPGDLVEVVTLVGGG